MTSNQYTIRHANANDISSMVELSKAKRLAYEKVQPQFWRHAEDAELQQTQWFQSLLNNPDYLLKVATRNQSIQGFIIGHLRQAPEVYNPGGLTLEIDDFCVCNNLWHEIGTILLDAMKIEAKSKRATQVLIVTGAHDETKRQFLKNQALSIASEWYVSHL
jgi:hypothetical protein